MMVILIAGRRTSGARERIQNAPVREWQLGLQQVDKFCDRKTGLADDCTQRAALEIAAMDWNRHIASRIGSMDQTTMAARGSRHSKAHAPTRSDNVLGFDGR
jgi:hypothetical protein